MTLNPTLTDCPEAAANTHSKVLVLDKSQGDAEREGRPKIRNGTFPPPHLLTTIPTQYAIDQKDAMSVNILTMGQIWLAIRRMPVRDPKDRGSDDMPALGGFLLEVIG